MAGVALGVIVTLISAQIAMRVFTGNSLSWPDELARLFFIYLVFIGAAEASVRHSHIAVDLRGTFGLSARIDRVLDLVRMALSIIVLIVIAWGAWQIIPVIQNMQLPATRLSMAWMYLPVLLGSILMIVATAINLIACLSGNENYRSHASDISEGME